MTKPAIYVVPFLFCLASVASLHADVFKGRSAPQQITAPGDWSSSTPDKSETQLIVTDPSGDVGVMLLYQNGADLDLSLQDYADTILKQMIGDLTDSDHTDWTRIKVNDMDALRCQLSGTRDNLKLKYLVTVLKGPDSYNQVLAFTKRSLFADRLEELTTISDSFKVSPQPPATARADIILKGKSGHVQLQLPGNWESFDIDNHDSELAADDSHTGCYVMVVSEGRADLTYTLKQYADKSLDGMISRGSDAAKSDWESVKVNGNDALRCTLALTTDKIKVKYVVTIVQTENNFNQVLAWSLASRFDANKPELQATADGFSEIKSK